MNIKQAKDYIKNTVRLYLKKDEYGEYRIPVVRQRPVFLLGAPGVGKTAIMEQIAQELQIALVSYSMTHHTRQSALGLPFIAHREFRGMEYDVSEYTMSEIIASIYEVMEQSGMSEGILFLDEINCVSETLAPSMLQFLQYKVFGRHAVPKGWVIVTAGNPPEYNRSVREFDVVTMDRLKVLTVEADYQAWKEYARARGIHGAILNFLDLKKDCFYRIETTVNGRGYVTARGWEDLSQILFLYEEEGMRVDETLVEQYLRSEKIVREFTAYYDLYQKYRQSYPIEEILQGRAGAQTLEQAGQAAFDERLSLLGMLTDRVISEIREDMERSEYLVELLKNLRALRAASEKTELSMEQMLENQMQGRKKQMEALKAAGSLSHREQRRYRRLLRFLEQQRKELLLQGEGDAPAAFERLRAAFEEEKTLLKSGTEQTKARLENLFAFAEKAFAKGNELLILVTELTVNDDSARFISQFGSEAYQRSSRELMLSERQEELQRKIEELEI